MSPRQLAHELALALTMRGELLRDGARLTEGVGEIAMGSGDEHAGARDALLEVLATRPL